MRKFSEYKSMVSKYGLTEGSFRYLTPWGRYWTSAEIERDDLAQYNKHLESLASKDPLTGMFNRLSYADCLDREFRRSLLNGPMAILMLDADHFKDFNDTYGHDAGDEALRIIASSITDVVRPTDFAYRIGGEEVAVIMPSADMKVGCIAGERIRAAIEKNSNDWAKMKPHYRGFTVSIGVASYPEIYVTDIKELVKESDKALYIAKKLGRNRVCTPFDDYIEV